MAISLKLYTMLSMSFCLSMLLKLYLHSGSFIEFLCKVYQSWMALFLLTNLLMIFLFKKMMKIYEYFIHPLRITETKEVSTFSWILLMFSAVSLIGYNDDLLFHVLVIFDVVNFLFLGYLVFLRVKYLNSHPKCHILSFHRNLYIFQFACFFIYVMIYKQIKLYLQTVYNPFVSFLSFIFLCGSICLFYSIIQHTIILVGIENSLTKSTEMILYGLLFIVAGYYFFEHLLTGNLPINFGLFAIFSINKAITRFKTILTQRQNVNFIRTQFKQPSHEDLEKDDVCIICRQVMKTSESIKLPCGHCFHAECIEEWVSNHPYCPTCFKSYQQTESEE